jgi:environmental stress-induced protein Ves
MTMTLHPAQGRPASLWKNGRGTTREIAAFPSGTGLDTFAWRVSIADIREDGPFSLFPGVDRQLVMLEGILALHVAGAAAVTLSPRSTPFAFSGDAACVAALLTSAATDLNVMTRRGRFRSRMRLVEGDGVLAPASQAGATLLVSLGETIIETGGTVFAMARLDAICGDGPLADPIRYSSRRAEAGLYVISIFEAKDRGTPG